LSYRRDSGVGGDGRRRDDGKRQHASA